MLTWTPNEWGTMAFEVFASFFTARFFYGLALAMLGAERAPYEINVTVTHRAEPEGDA